MLQLRMPRLRTNHDLDVFNACVFDLEGAKLDIRLKRNDKVERFGVESHLNIRRRRISRRARMRMINPEQGLSGLAYSPHCREQFLGRREISCLGVIGAVS